MKSLFFIILSVFLWPSSLLAQWVLTDSSTVNYDKYNTKDWYYFMESGEELYCGLPTENQLFSFEYYKRNDLKNIVLCKIISLKDSSYSIGFYKLNELKEKKTCWQKDLIWLSFDRNGKLLKQDFYNSFDIVKPKKFILKDSK